MKDFLIAVIVVLGMVCAIAYSFVHYESKIHDKSDIYIKINELNGKNAVVVKKYLKKGAYGCYHLNMDVRINDKTRRIYGTTPEIYEQYNVGDTIKYIGMEYK